MWPGQQSQRGRHQQSHQEARDGHSLRTSTMRRAGPITMTADIVSLCITRHWTTPPHPYTRTHTALNLTLTHWALSPPQAHTLSIELTTSHIQQVFWARALGGVSLVALFFFSSSLSNKTLSSLGWSQTCLARCHLTILTPASQPPELASTLSPKGWHGCWGRSHNPVDELPYTEDRPAVPTRGKDYLQGRPL